MRVTSLKALGKGAWKLAPEYKELLENAKPKRRQPSGSPPHDLLWDAIATKHPGVVREHREAVPGRAFRIDIAFVDEKLAVEIDGWQWHGKHLGDFQRDRQRQNLLTIHGWRILRFTAGEIYKDIEGCLAMVQTALGK